MTNVNLAYTLAQPTLNVETQSVATHVTALMVTSDKEKYAKVGENFVFLILTKGFMYCPIDHLLCWKNTILKHLPVKLVSRKVTIL